MECISQYTKFVLKHDIIDENGRILVAQGTELNDKIINKLTKRNIIVTYDDVYEFEDENVEAQAFAKFERIFVDTTEEIKQIHEYIRKNNVLPIAAFKSEIVPSIEAAANTLSVRGLFFELQRKDGYTYRHTLAVGLLAYIIGRWLELSEGELQTLVLAAALHDIGKAVVPNAILNKHDKLTEMEYNTIKTHTSLGYDLIMNTEEGNGEIANVALNHHERLDGSGYPNQLQGNQIDLYSRIVAIADVFHAMVSNRVYREGLSFYEAMRELYDSSFHKLDAKIVHVFIKNMMISLLNATVLLVDGTKGKIVYIDPNEPLSPIIQTQHTFIDLKKNRHLSIHKIVLKSE